MYRILSITLTLAAVSACKKAEDAPADPAVVAKVADPATKLDPMAKPAVDLAAKTATALAAAAVDPTADPKMAALATEALTKMNAFKDKVCACKDKACADKVQDEVMEWGKNLENTTMKDFKPDQATTDKLDALEHAMSDCADKAAGGVPEDPKAMGVNNETETKFIALMDRMTDMFTADAANCDKLAADLKKFTADNKPFMDQIVIYEKSQSEAQKHAFEVRNKAHSEAGSAKIMPVMQACATNPALQAVLKDMPM